MSRNSKLISKNLKEEIAKELRNKTDINVVSFEKIIMSYE